MKKIRKEFQRFLNRIIRPSWIVIDCGGRADSHTLEMSKLATHIFAYKEDPYNLIPFERNISKIKNLKVPLISSDLEMIEKFEFIRIDCQENDYRILKAALELIHNFHPIILIESKVKSGYSLSLEGYDLFAIKKNGHIRKINKVTNQNTVAIYPNYFGRKAITLMNI